MLNFDFKPPFQSKNLFSLFSAPQGFYKGFPFDVQGIIEAQRKNMQAVTDAQETLMKGMQSAVRQQTEIFSAALQNQSALISLLSQAGTPEEKMARQTELSKQHYSNAVNDIRRVHDTVSESIRNAADILHHRVAGTFSESQRQAGKLIIAANNSDITERKVAA